MEKLHRCKSKPIFSEASQTEWHEPFDFQPEFPVFPWKSYVPQDYPQGQLEKSKVTTFAREECLTEVVSDHFSLQFLSWYLLSYPIRHFRNEKVTGAEMLPAIILSIVTRDALVRYWPIFFLSRVTIPEVFAKVNSAQFPLVSKVANSQKTAFFCPYGRVGRGDKEAREANCLLQYKFSFPVRYVSHRTVMENLLICLE